MRVENHEGAAYQKMMAGLRHAEEGAMELAIHRSDDNFRVISAQLKTTRERIGMIAASAHKRLVGVR
ncbi:hypothetical protein [Gluconobacter oxydans]|uniref:hypothetical protein n=1 Tax=Gluconobacter oxydans TaxID=442 RepID=UPI00078198C4|nr:hypothetical protein [Gluconobacter oxydans]KXV13948.1 hypothetical protein AD932_03415 [Gluconobacter oxydans]